ncbi:MAG TPA: NUDIX domain-containing protein [Terriglobia bacterium]|nr:NUDIX domain-containing protein [Terriglobia bacterium]
MAKISAGLLMYRHKNRRLEFLLVHPGGPLYAKKDEGVWSIPKGEVEPGNDEFSTAKREFEEETGLTPRGDFLFVGEIKQKGGKIVRAWAFEGDCDPAMIRSNTFRMEWPPHSGKIQEFPEVDRGAFFELEEAKRKINPAQVGLLLELAKLVGR